MRKAASAFALVLLAFAAVQLNDPDPLGWTAIYASAALTSALFAWARPVRPLALAIAGIAAVWALRLVPEALQLNQLGDFTRRMDIMRPEIEVARELGGLTIVLLWMAMLAWLSPSSSPRAQTSPPPGPPPRGPTPARS